jgi:transcription initiation factor IIF auxiliary subunit
LVNDHFGELDKDKVANIVKNVIIINKNNIDATTSSEGKETSYNKIAKVSNANNIDQKRKSNNDKTQTIYNKLIIIKSFSKLNSKFTMTIGLLKRVLKKFK